MTACDQNPSNSTQRKARTHLVNTITIEPENSIIERRFNAQIIAPNTVKISNQVAGTILKMPFREGSSVQKGELLVQLDDSLTTAELKKAQANFEKASQNLNRIQKLIPKQLASAEEMSAASTDLKLAEADITLKTIQLERSKIRAPFSGVISERFYEPGDSIISNKQLLTLVDDDLLLARSAIPETFISFITKDKAVKINIPSLHLNLEGKL
ncbi:MAG: efflux RND transporter periplasmic adaptor subunit, partial [Gammaproteobacteria bacterium]|nr:efflux RND transporter periplasmic adaptor subunit [Gammaproteobacteria bacterium]